MNLFYVARLLLFSLLVLMLQSGFAQKERVLSLQKELDSLSKTVPYEKLYVHLDKPSYLLGDSIFYKVYVLDGTFPYPSKSSGIVYIELYGPDGNLVQRSRQHLLAGTTYGALGFPENDRTAGNYTLRAYTRWLQNFGTDYYFEHCFQVEGDIRQDWTADLQPVEVTEADGKQRLHVQMALKKLHEERFPVTPVQVVLRNDKEKQIAAKTVVTDNDGVLDLQLDLPTKQNLSPLQLAIVQEGNTKLQFPLQGYLPKRENDIQFLPESGHWLTDLPATFGVKAVAPDGKGIGFEGFILKENGDTICNFNALHAGIGRVQVPPLRAGRYWAVVRFADGSRKRVELPQQQHAGTIIHLSTEQDLPSTALPFTILMDSLTAQTHNDLLFIVKSRGILCYGAILRLQENSKKILLERETLPEGLLQVCVLSSDGAPLAERLVYNRQITPPALNLRIQPDRSSYGTRDSIALQVSVRDSLGKPVKGNFSLSVTDDDQVSFSGNELNINTYYYLQAELKGQIEDPGYYFSGSQSSDEALDNLLLTQGWVRYDQSWLKKYPRFSFQPEPYFQLSGVVKNAFGKPVKGVGITMLGLGEYNLFDDTLSNDDGRFRFDSVPPFDTLGFIVQARNKRGKSFNVGIELDADFKPTTEAPGKWPELNSWFVNLDTGLRKRIMDKRTYEQNRLSTFEGLDPNTIILEEVNVTAKKYVKNSKNLNGPGEADQLLSEEDLLPEGSKTLLQVLYDKIDGFRTGFYPRKYGKPEFMVHDKKARLIFDGIDLEFFYEPSSANSVNDHLLFLQSYLEHYRAEDVLGVEIMYNPRHNSAYNTRFLDILELMNINPVMGTDPVYIEITTRGNAGPFMKRTPGVAHLRPMPFTWPKEFYRPRYPAENELPPGTDLRSTIHWEPMVITNEDGQAIVSFYSSDRKGNYTVRIEGMDFEGNLGVSHSDIAID